MKICDALVFALRELHVQYVFGVSGANIEHLHDALNRLGEGKIQSILAKSESGAAYMADAQARVHQRLGVCCATSGGGMLNLLPGIAESYAESVPVLAIVGQAPLTLEGKGAFQDSCGQNHSIDGEQLWKSVSKFTAKIHKAEEFWPYFHQAVTEALTGRPGPSVLLIPRDVYELEVEDIDSARILQLQELCAQTLNSNSSDIDTFIEHIRSASSPIMIVGHGARRTHDLDPLLAFIEQTQIPVATTLSGRAEVPNSLPNYLGSVGAAGHPSVHRYMADTADLIIVVGSGMGLMNRGPISSVIDSKHSVFINIDKSPIAAAFPSASIFLADVGNFFGHVNTKLAGHFPRFELLPNYRREFYRPMLAKPERQAGLLQSEAIAMIERILPEGGHLLFDAGNCAAAAMHYTHAPNNSSSTIALGMGAMGYAVGGAIGAQIGSGPGTRTIAFVGDGAFLMSGLEIHTAVELGLPILYIIFNNSMHGMCVTRQKLYFENRIECATYNSIDISQVARGLGGPDRLWVARVQSKDDLRKALADYQRNTDKPGVLELVLNQEELPPFAPFLPKDAPTCQKL